MKKFLLVAVAGLALGSSSAQPPSDVHSPHHQGQGKAQSQQGQMQGMMMPPFGYMIIPFPQTMMGQRGMMGGMMPMMGMMGMGGMGMMGGMGQMGPTGMLRHQIMSDPKLRKLIEDHQKKCKQELIKKLSQHPSFIEKLVNVIAMHPEAVREALKRNPELRNKLKEILK
jgi:hypothetical protein